MDENLLLTPRGEKIVVTEVKEEQKVGQIIIASGKIKSETKLRLYKVVAKPVIDTDRTRDIVIGSSVLIRPDDVNAYDFHGKTYFLVDEDFIYSFVNE